MLTTCRHILLTTLAFGCAAEDYARLYATGDVAPSLDWDEITELQHMGAVMVDGGVNFTVYSENATRIELLLFDDPEANCRPGKRQ